MTVQLQPAEETAAEAALSGVVGEDVHPQAVNPLFGRLSRPHHRLQMGRAGGRVSAYPGENADRRVHRPRLRGCTLEQPAESAQLKLVSLRLNLNDVRVRGGRRRDAAT